MSVADLVTKFKSNYLFVVRSRMIEMTRKQHLWIKGNTVSSLFVNPSLQLTACLPSVFKLLTFQTQILQNLVDSAFLCKYC